MTQEKQMATVPEGVHTNLADRAAAAFATQAEFLVTHRGDAHVVLIVEGTRSRTYAWVTAAEAFAAIPGAEPAILKQLERDPVEMNRGVPGSLWLVAVFPEGSVQMTIATRSETAPPFETLRAKALEHLSARLAEGPTPVPPPGGYFLLDVVSDRRSVSAADAVQGLAIAQRLGLDVEALKANPGEEPGMRREWVIAVVDGSPIYFWFNFFPLPSAPPAGAN